MEDELSILIDSDGTIRHVYDDRLAPLLVDVGVKTTVRASHVEPHGDGWIADMGPSGGPVLFFDDDGCVPFETRQAALDAEREWLRREKGL